MSVLHSIVLALGIARVLGGIAGVVRYWRQLETKWFFLGWLALLLLLHLGWWFGLWIRFGEVSDISLWTFFFWFLIPASLYIASRLLIPEFHEGSPPDVKQRFDKVRMPFFACLVLAIIPIFPGLADAARTDWLLAVFGGLALTGLFVSDRRGHVALLCLMLGTFVTFLALARSSLGN